MFIYKITNKINNMVYIGQTIVSISNRWRDHCSVGSNCTYLSRAITSYKKQNFTIEQIDSALTIDELNQKEIYWIAFYNSTNQEFGYNLSIGGDSSPCHEDTKIKIGLSNTGKKRTDEAKEKMRNAQLGKKQSQEQIEKRRAKLIGKKRTKPNKNKGIPRPKDVIEKMVATRKLKGNYKHTEETKQVMRELKLGTKLSKEHKQKIGNKMRNIPKTPEALENMKKARKKNNN